MKTRLIALFLTLAMVVSLAPAVVADDTIPRPTVEEILNEYHQKAFEAEAAGEAIAASYSPRSGFTAKTLEQETVDNLNAAGYEAYNVTAENYEALETQLKTDFADMGLDPDGSYIIAISGEESDDSSASGINPRAMVPVEPDYGCGDSFTHTYNGTTYTMRYLTVTTTIESKLFRSFSYTLSSDQFSETWQEILFAGLAYSTDAVLKVPIASIFSLLIDINTDNNFELLDNEDVKILGNTTWTLQYIQIHNPTQDAWISAQSSEYAESRAYCSGYLYNSSTNKAQRYIGNESVFTTSSPQFNNYTQRKNIAVSAYLNYNGTAVLRDKTGDIDFYLMDETYSFNYCGDGNPLFTQPHWDI